VFVTDAHSSQGLFLYSPLGGIRDFAVQIPYWFYARKTEITPAKFAMPDAITITV